MLSSPESASPSLFFPILFRLSLLSAPLRLKSHPSLTPSPSHLIESDINKIYHALLIAYKGLQMKKKKPISFIKYPCHR